MAKSESIVGSRPVDGVAARVVGPGYQYVPRKRLCQELWVGPPPMMPTPAGDESVGTTRGRMTIVGYLERHKLLARCVCGNYERRDAYNWRKGVRNSLPEPGCQMCRHDAYLKDKDAHRRSVREAGAGHAERA